MDNVALCLLTYSHYMSGMFTGKAEFSPVNTTVNRFVIFWVTQKNKVVYGYHSSDIGSFDPGWNLMAETMVNVQFVFDQTGHDPFASPGGLQEWKPGCNNA